MTTSNTLPNYIKLDDDDFTTFINSLVIRQPVKVFTKNPENPINNNIYYFVFNKNNRIFLLNDKYPFNIKNIFLDSNKPLENEYEIIAMERIDEQPIEKIPTKPVVKPKSTKEGIVEEEIQVEVEEYIEEISKWQREYSNEEIRQSLIEQLDEYYHGRKNFTNLVNESQSIMDLVKKYQKYENGNKVNDIQRSGNNFKPYYKKIIENNFKHIEIYPIVADKKKFYIRNKALLEDSEIDNSNLYLQKDELELLVNLYKMYARSSKKHVGLSQSQFLDYNRFVQLLYNGGTIDIENDDGEIENITFEPINRPYINNNRDNSTYYKVKLNHQQIVFRKCIPIEGLQCDPNPDFSENPKIGVSRRIADGPITTLKDKLEDSFVTDTKGKYGKIKTCNGTNKTGDLFYGGKEKATDFNRTIIKPPMPVELVGGEELVIIGFYLKSPKRYIKNIISGDEEVTQNGDFKYYPKIFNDGYLFGKTTTKSLSKNVEVIEDADSFSWSTYKLDHDYMVFFNINETKQLNNQEYVSMMEKILPSVQNILDIEKESVANATNFMDLQKILNKYSLDIRNISNTNMLKYEIRKQLINKIIEEQNLQNILKHRYLSQKNNLKQYISLYKTLLTIKYKCEETVLKNIYSFPNEIDLENIKRLFIQRATLSLSNYSNEFLESFLINYLLVDYDDEIDRSILISLIIDSFMSIVQFSFNQSEFYKYFINPTHLVDKKYSKLFNEFIDVYKINPTYFDILNHSNFDSSTLNQLEFIKQIKNLPDAGVEFYKLINLSNIEKYRELIRGVIETYAKNDYESSTNLSWENLDEEQRVKYYPNLEKLKLYNNLKKDLLNTYELEKKKYNFYLNRCQNIRIVKVYRDYHILTSDNNKDIYYDSTFDTTKNDIKLYTNYILENREKSEKERKKEFRNLLKRHYLFDTEEEIKLKYNNVLNNFGTLRGRMVTSGEICMLLDNDKKILFRRIQNVWVPIDNDSINNISRCYDFNDKFLTMSFDEIVNYCSEHTDVDLEYHNQNKNVLEKDEQNCLFTQEGKIPKYLYSFIYYHNTLDKKINNLVKILKFQDEIDDEIERDKTFLDNKLKFLKTIDEKKKRIMAKKPVIIKSNLVYPPKQLLTELNLIRRIEDFDLMGDLLTKFLEKYGLEYNRNAEQDNPEAKSNTAKFYYYDLPNVNVPIICKHFKPLLTTIYLDNETKNNILEEVKRDWSTIVGGYHICKNCGEPIDIIKYSEFEGFGKNDRVIVVREKVVEEKEVDAELLTLEYTENELKVKDKLDSIIKVINLKLIPEDYKFVIEKASKLYEQIPDLHDFYFNILKNLEVPAIKSKINNDVYAQQEMEFMKEHGKFTREVFVNIIKNRDQLKKYSKLVENFMKIEGGKPTTQPGIFIRLAYGFSAVYLLKSIISVLINVVRTGIPDYVIAGTGTERKTGGIVIRDFYINEVYTLEYLSNISYGLINSVSETNKDEIYLYAKLYLTNIYKGNEKTSYRNLIEETYREINEFIEFKNRNEKKDEYRTSLLLEDKAVSDISYEWNEFLPLLNIILDFEYEIPNVDSLIENYIDDYSKLSLVNATIKNAEPSEDKAMLEEKQILLVNSIRDILNTLKLISNKLSYLLINNINKIVSTEVQDVYRVSSYTSNIGFDRNIAKYLDFYINRNPQILLVKQQLDKVNNFLVRNEKTTTKFITFVEYNSSTRDLQRFMYLDTKLFNDDSRLIKKVLINKLKQINYIVNTTDGKFKGSRRIFKTITDPDYYLLIEIYSENPDITEGQLREKLIEKLYDTYGERIRDELDIKLRLLLDYNGKAEVDIVSGEFKNDIEMRIDSLTNNKSIDDIYSLIYQFESYSDTKNLVYKSDLPMINDVVIKDKKAKVRDISSNNVELLNDIFKIGCNIYQDSSNYDMMNNKLDNLQNILDKISIFNESTINEQNIKILNIYDEIFGDCIEEKIENIAKSINNINNKLSIEHIKNILNNLGSSDNYFNEIIQNIPNTLKIEGIYEEYDIAIEKKFRKNFINEYRNSYKINVHKQVINHLLTVLYLFENNYIYNEKPLKLKSYTSLDNSIIQSLLEKYNREILTTIQQKITDDISIPLDIPYNKIREFLNNLTCYENDINSNGMIKNMYINNPYYAQIYTKLIILYLLDTLVYPTDSENYRICSVVLINIYNFIENVYGINNLSDKEIFELIKTQRADENLARLKRFQSLPDELKNTQKLYRRFNLGDIFGGFEDDISNIVNEEVLFHSEDILENERNMENRMDMLVNKGLSGQQLVDGMENMAENAIGEMEIDRDALTMRRGVEDDDNFLDDDDMYEEEYNYGD